MNAALIVIDSALSWCWSIFVKRFDDGFPFEDSFIFPVNNVAILWDFTVLVLSDLV